MAKAHNDIRMRDTGLTNDLAAIVGVEHVRLDDSARTFFATDIFTSGPAVDAVVAPADSEQLAAVIRRCARAGCPIIPRGAGFSYTQGYVPAQAGSISIDTRRMDAIIEINARDLYVVVEPGCTWRALFEALKEKGLRTPYFGPMSGYHATVGGALSQGSFFLGSTQYGTTADSVLGLEVVLADGSTLVTGSGACTNGANAFFRHYGPDLTGIFLHDSGALGFKTKAVLKLIPSPAHQRFATFAFDAGSRAQALNAMTLIAHAGIAAECYLWNPEFAAKMAASSTMAADLRYFADVVKSGRGLLGGIKDGLMLAKTGKKFLVSDRYLLHVTFDDVSDAGVQAKLDQALRIAAADGGESIEPSVPRALRARPFNDFTELAFADQSQRNLPTHGILPHSRIEAAAAAVEEFFVERRAKLIDHGITIGTIFFAVGSNAVCCEPLFYWTDPQLAAHDRSAERSDLEALATMPDRPAAGQVVAEIRAELVTLFTRFGAVHCQIGKSYPYAETRQPETLALLKAIKAAVDPSNIVNPGSLGI